MSGPPVGLEVHEDLHGIRFDLPVHRDRGVRGFAWLALGAVALVGLAGQDVLPFVALVVLTLLFRDRRRVHVHLDGAELRVERVELGRPVVHRIPLVDLRAVEERDGQLIFHVNRSGLREEALALRVDRRADIRRWLAERIRTASVGARAPEPMPPPPEALVRMRQRT